MTKNEVLLSSLTNNCDTTISGEEVTEIVINNLPENTTLIVQDVYLDDEWYGALRTKLDSLGIVLKLEEIVL